MVLLLLVPGGLSDPVEGEACICSDLDGSCLGLPDRLLHRLHQVLSIVDQHLSSLLKNKYKKVMKKTGIIHFNGYLGKIIDNLVIRHAKKKRLGSPALTPLH